jgi:hypothetical protein
MGPEKFHQGSLEVNAHGTWDGQAVSRTYRDNVHPDRGRTADHGRGVGYKLFVAQLIASMSTNDMQTVYRLLKIARERGTIPWDWIVDETRGLEGVAIWSNPAAYIKAVERSYRRDFWKTQSHRVQLWSEKGTVRGLIRPVLDAYGVKFNPVHGFTSATDAHNASVDDDGRPLHVLYAGDYDCSGLYMSEVDLPNSFAKYGGNHIMLRRIALTRQQVRTLPSFPASNKRKDPRYKWFIDNHGSECWELDAMDPNALRNLVEQEIRQLIEPVAWARCETVYRAEKESLKHVLERWCA